MANRLTADPFPAYSYVPGKWPHPRREPDGHSHGEPEPTVSAFDPDRWQDCGAYLFGIDLFNHGFYWESHEQWEAVWLSVGRKGVVANFLKGLIKLSAAGVKLKEQRPAGVRRHAIRARELFDATQQTHESLCGLKLTSLIVFSDAIRNANTEHDVLLLFEAKELVPGVA